MTDDPAGGCQFAGSRGEIGRGPMQALILVGAIAVWGAIHSWLASLGAKRVLRNVAGGAGRSGYRLAYNAFAVISFIPIVWLALSLPDRRLYLADTPWRYMMVAGQVAAGALLVLTLLATDPLHFAGLRQLVEGPSQSKLVTGGFYRWVRHPLYLFGLIFIWLTPLMTVNLLTIILVLTAYIVVGAALEERRLLQEFGDEYRAYRERTPMLVPGVRLRRGKARQ